MDQTQRNLAIAYSSYAFVGFAYFAFKLGDVLLKPSTSAQVFGMVVGIPLLFAAFGAFVLGLIQTIRFWRNRQLLALFLLTLLLVAAFFLSQNQVFVLGVSAIYAIASISIFLLWLRKQEMGPGPKLLPGFSSSRIRYDLAYGCFSLCGLSVIIMSSMVLALTRMESIAPAFGVVIALPSQIALPAGAIGIVLAIMLWRQWQLPILALLTIVFAGFWLSSNGTQTIYYVAAWTYGLVTIAFFIHWFRNLRPRFGASLEA